MKFIIVVFLASFNTCIAQQAQHSIDVNGDTVTLENGARFWKNQKISIGYGSNANKGFEFIRRSPFAIEGPVALPQSYSSYKATIRGFKVIGNKKVGKKLYLVLGAGTFLDYWCDIYPAIDTKEIIIPGINDKPNSTQTSQSLGDELKKLKDLFDSGALSKEEYGAAKKKLLN